MSDLGLEEIEKLAGGLIRRLDAAERRSLLRALARDIQQGQRTRVARTFAG